MMRLSGQPVTNKISKKTPLKIQEIYVNKIKIKFLIHLFFIRYFQEFLFI